MFKKLLIPFVAIILLAASCKKDPVAVPVTVNNKTLNFSTSGSVAAPVKVIIEIVRPAATAGAADVEIAYISVSNIVSTYNYTATKLHTGDHVDIVTYTTQNQPITGALTIDGVSKSSTSSAIDTVNNLSAVEWNCNVE